MALDSEAEILRPRSWALHLADPIGGMRGALVVLAVCLAVGCVNPKNLILDKTPGDRVVTKHSASTEETRGSADAPAVAEARAEILSLVRDGRKEAA